MRKLVGFLLLLHPIYIWFLIRSYSYDFIWIIQGQYLLEQLTYYFLSFIFAFCGLALLFKNPGRGFLRLSFLILFVLYALRFPSSDFLDYKKIDEKYLVLLSDSGFGGSSGVSRLIVGKRDYFFLFKNKNIAYFDYARFGKIEKLEKGKVELEMWYKKENSWKETVDYSDSSAAYSGSQ